MEFQEYCPNPVDTSGVELPIELHSLVEQMARNVHDVWAVSRMNEGWQYGDERNDQEKTHPCLVSYDSLPDSEKAYDRDTAVTTLKLILKLGFRIEKECCDWSGRQDDDICGLDNSRLDLYDKMKHILVGTCLSYEFKRYGLEGA